ncbi:MAG: hypothetical protein ACREXX_15585 [Gammaproteobacteria bacterium]
MSTGFRVLLHGDCLIGTLMSLPSAEVAELLAEGGFDWFFIDAGHGPFDSERALRLWQAIGGRARRWCASPGERRSGSRRSWTSARPA